MGNQKLHIPSLLGKIMLLAACVIWLVFAMDYCSGATNASLFPQLPILERFMSSFPGDQKPMRLYFGCTPLPFLSFFLLLLVRSCKQHFPRLYHHPAVRRWFTVTAVLLLIFTAFCNACLSQRLVHAWRFWQHFGIVGLGSAKAVASRFAAIGMYIALACLLLSLFLVILSPILGRIRKTPSLPLRRRIGLLLLCLAVELLFSLGSALLLNLYSAIDPQGVAQSSGVLAATTPSLVLVSIVFAPVMEEVAFRGVLHPMAEKALPKGWAILFSAICFGLWHRNMVQFVYTVFGGIVWGIVASSTGRILETLLMHSLGNLISVLISSTLSTSVLGPQPFWVALNRWLMALPLPIALLLLLLTCISTAGLLVPLHWLSTGSPPRFLEKFLPKHLH